jgi:hypothetical protein
MSKRPITRTASPLYEWRIIRLKKTPAALLGYVNAPDQEQAIRKAIVSFGVTDPTHQSRPMAGWMSPCCPRQHAPRHVRSPHNKQTSFPATGR